MKILVAEDESDIRNLIREQLELEGYEVLLAEDGAHALQLFEAQQPDLALLDIMMPRMDGMSVLRKIRQTSDTPVIFVTARGEEADRISGLAQGADDYLVKPFSLAELCARIEVQKRHLTKQKDRIPSTIKIGNLELDFICGEVRRGSDKVILNAKEYGILRYFVENQGKVLTKRQIYQAVWEEDFLYDDNTIMVQISHLRGKIEDSEFRYIQTMKGIGYRFMEMRI